MGEQHNHIRVVFLLPSDNVEVSVTSLNNLTPPLKFQPVMKDAEIWHTRPIIIAGALMHDSDAPRLIIVAGALMHDGDSPRLIIIAGALMHDGDFQKLIPVRYVFVLSYLKFVPVVFLNDPTFIQG